MRAKISNSIQVYVYSEWTLVTHKWKNQILDWKMDYDIISLWTVLKISLNKLYWIIFSVVWKMINVPHLQRAMNANVYNFLIQSFPIELAHLFFFYHIYVFHLFLDIHFKRKHILVNSFKTFISRTERLNNVCWTKQISRPKLLVWVSTMKNPP